MASVTRNIEAKLTHVEHKYGKTLEQLRPNFVWTLPTGSRRRWRRQRSSSMPLNGPRN
jgi:hypothetical protein